MVDVVGVLFYCERVCLGGFCSVWLPLCGGLFKGLYFEFVLRDLGSYGF